MTARTHDLAAITALGAALVLAPQPSMTLSTALIGLLANQIGGIVPDIDQPTAPLWRNLPLGHFIGRVIDKLLGGHRFLSHSLIGAAIFGGLANLLLHLVQPIIPHADVQLIWYAFLIGLVSHLVMDSFTKEGVPWLLPIPVKFGFPPIPQLRLTTGKSVELFVVLPILVILDVWLCINHYPAIVAYLHHLVR